MEKLLPIMPQTTALLLGIILPPVIYAKWGLTLAIVFFVYMLGAVIVFSWAGAASTPRPKDPEKILTLDDIRSST